MDEPQRSDSADAAQACADSLAPVAALRAAGADRFDPVGLRYLEALAGRAAAHRGQVRRLLDARLAQALAAFGARFERAQGEAGEAVAGGAAQFPHAAGELRRLFDAGDFKGVQRRIAALKADEQRASLGALVRRLEQHSADHTGARSELKTIRQFRNTWSKLSAGKQVAQALGQAPANAGPINSHMLVLRSLALMRDIAPDYLNRFMSYTDTLLCLDQGEKEKPASPKKPAAPRAAKK